MMRLPLFVVDAFADGPFTGNPAAVVPLDDWLEDPLLQAIAAQNNLAETAFFVAKDHGYALRWFTPTAEVALCGHATLASAFVLTEVLNVGAESLVFETRRSGQLSVSREAQQYWLDLPRQTAKPAAAPAGLIAAVGAAPEAVLAGPNWLLRYGTEAEVQKLSPDMRSLRELPERCVIATAAADDAEVDFVSRFFAPNFGVDEDPVTGSAHCMLTPYWATSLKKTTLAAKQISTRGGRLECRLAGERVQVGGRAQLYLEGEILIPELR